MYTLGFLKSLSGLTVETNVKWLIYKPVDKNYNFTNRIRDAWFVLIGKADAFTWLEKKHYNEVRELFKKEKEIIMKAIQTLMGTFFFDQKSWNDFKKKWKPSNKPISFPCLMRGDQEGATEINCSFVYPSDIQYGIDKIIGVKILMEEMGGFFNIEEEHMKIVKSSPPN